MKRTFKRMLDAGLKPDLRDFTIIVQSLHEQPVEDLQSVLMEMQQRGVKYDSVFADKYLEAVLSLGQGRRNLGKEQLARRLSKLSAARKEAAAAALAHFVSKGSKLSSFCQTVETALKLQGFV